MARRCHRLSPDTSPLLRCRHVYASNAHARCHCYYALRYCYYADALRQYCYYALLFTLRALFCHASLIRYARRHDDGFLLPTRDALFCLRATGMRICEAGSVTSADARGDECDARERQARVRGEYGAGDSRRAYVAARQNHCHDSGAAVRCCCAIVDDVYALRDGSGSRREDEEVACRCSHVPPLRLLPLLRVHDVLLIARLIERAVSHAYAASPKRRDYFECRHRAMIRVRRYAYRRCRRLFTLLRFNVHAI